MLSPNGRTVIINNGREIRPVAWLESMKPFRDAERDARETFAFPNAGLATLKRDDVFVVFDGSVFTGEISHFQGGKNAPIYWLRNRPLLVDSGCPLLYDDELFTKWYKRTDAHSTPSTTCHPTSGGFSMRKNAPRTTRCSNMPRTRRIASSATSEPPCRSIGGVLELLTCQDDEAKIDRESREGEGRDQEEAAQGEDHAAPLGIAQAHAQPGGYMNHHGMPQFKSGRSRLSFR